MKQAVGHPSSNYRRLFTALALIFAAAAWSIAYANDDEPLTSFLNQPINTIDGYFPTPWACLVANPGTQNVLQFHRNWHCTNPDSTGPNWGNRFFGFHTQFTLGFDRYAAANGFPYTQTWVPSPGALIPPAHGGRPANAPCPTCIALPNNFRLPSAGGTLDSFATVDAIGNAIVQWHNLNHGRIGQSGGTGCNTQSGPQGDMSCVATSPRDPIFYRYHHIFDDVRNAWRTHQPTDIMLVFDRSGSMSLPAVGGGSRLQAAKDAANMLADLLEDGSGHRLGLASFATTASSPADMPLTGVAAAPAAMSSALGGLVANGMTSIGAGLQAATASLAGGSNQRKAILLLTDGIENTNPTIANVQGALGDTHLCSIGFGQPGTIDGPKLRDLSERQGGIYISGPGALELRKFFLECFADIFDSFVGEDPVEVLRAGQLASAATTHVVLGDDKVTFVLSWDSLTPETSLQLEVTSPSGQVVDLSDPAVESTLGSAWHIVRINLPLQGEQDGAWQARAVRTTNAFVNGFMSDAFVDIFAGAELIAEQIRHLCGGGCANVLFYEDDHMGAMEEMTFDMMLSAYTAALFDEAGRGTIAKVVKTREPGEFAELLRKGGYDLLVYSSRYAVEEQPYDEILLSVVCGDDAPRLILSDNRRVDAASELHRCAGAVPTGEANFDSIETSTATLKLEAPAMAMNAFSYAVEPIGLGEPVGRAPSGAAAVVAREVGGAERSYFITALTRAAARVVPFPWISQVYTGEALHPTFQIPEMYWPTEGYDSIDAVVEVTRPLRSVGAIAAEAGLQDRAKIDGDLIPPRAALFVGLALERREDVIPTETLRFPLFDDGTNGDGTANDHYWEASLPEGVAEFDGDYDLRAIFTLCRAGTCVQREARHTLDVETKMDLGATDFRVEALGAEGTLKRSRVVFTPMDANGLLLGPGLAESLQFEVFGEARIDSVGDLDNRGTYEVHVSWLPSFQAPALRIAQFGRPDDALVIELE